MSDESQVRGAGGGRFSSNAAMAAWMQEIAPFGIFTTDGELRIRNWNEWLVTHSGLAAEAVLGQRLIEVFPELEARHLYDRFSRALAGEISVLSTALHQYLLPMRVTVPDTGLPFMLQTARIAPLPDEGGIVGTITIIEDVTQREHQAGILHRQQEVDRLLSSALAALLQSRDPARDIAEIFPAIAPSLGLDAYVSYLRDAGGASLGLNAAGGVSPRHREVLATLPISGEDVTPKGRLQPTIPRTLGAHTETLRQIGLKACCSFPLVIGERLIGLVSFGSYQRNDLPAADVTTLARIARYVAIALDRSMREREAVEASRAKDEFLAALSHELRTPLNPVLLLASDSAMNDDYPASAREAFRVIEKNALLEARLIDDLLDLTRIERGKLQLELQRTDLHATLQDALSTVRGEASERNLGVEVAFSAQTSVILGDSGRLQQVFWNVLKNAIKFTPKGGRIRVESRTLAEANEIEIQISDTGIGMEPHELTRVFGAFSQGDHAEQSRGHRFGGLGLGLAISRKLVELHAGRIAAASEGRDRGATFSITLPLVGAGTPTAAGAVGGEGDERRAETDGPAATVAPTGRILLVEDHEPTRAPLTRLLVRRGYDVVAVGSAEAALAAAADAKFDLVLSDIGLPDSDGFELMRTLRERHGSVGIALTGYGMDQDLARSSEAGFIEHLTKPVNVAVLDRALAKALGASAASGAG